MGLLSSHMKWETAVRPCLNPGRRQGLALEVVLCLPCPFSVPDVCTHTQLYIFIIFFQDCIALAVLELAF